MGESGNTTLNDRNDQAGIPCPANDELSAYFDGAVAPTRASEIRRHVEQCQDCRETLAAFDLLRSSLRVGRDFPASRPIILTAADVDERPTPLPEPNSRTPMLLYPVLTAIAAVLVMALLTGQMLTGGVTSQDEPRASNDVLIINGTPFAAGDDETEFNAASADDMNRASDAGEAVATTNAENEVSTSWWLAFASSGALLLFGGLQWLRMSRRQIA